MGQSSCVQQKGVIAAIVGNKIDVKIVRAATCSTCKAKDACIGNDASERVISVFSDKTSYTGEDAFRVGEEVWVTISESMGFKAIGFAYIIPFLLLLTTLLVLLEFHCSELVAGGTALAMWGFYSIVLYFFRAKINRIISFDIEKIQ